MHSESEHTEHTDCGCATDSPLAVSRRSLIRAAGVMSVGLGIAAAGSFGTVEPAHADGPPRSRNWDGMHVVLLGTGGGPIPTAGRVMSSQAVVVDGVTYLIDCGSGIVKQIVDAGIPYGSIRSLFITHLHSDHVSDYLSTVLFGRRIGPQPGFSGIVDVYGPGRAGALPPGVPAPGGTLVNPANPTTGTVDMHNGSLDAFAYTINQMYIASASGPDIRDIVVPHDIQLPAGTGASAAGPVAPPMAPFTVFEDTRVKVTATLVNHGPVFPAFAFRFDSAYGSVVFSGDCAPSANLVTLAQGAGLLVHEVMFSEAMLAHATPAALVTFLRSLHTDVTELGRISTDAQVNMLALSHVISVEPVSAYPDTLPDSKWTRPIKQDFAGEVVMGWDLMHFKITGNQAKQVR